MTLMALVRPGQMSPSRPPGTHLSPPFPASPTYSCPSSPNARPRGLSNPLSTVVNFAFGAAAEGEAPTPIIRPSRPVVAAPIGMMRRHLVIMLIPFIQLAPNSLSLGQPPWFRNGRRPEMSDRTSREPERVERV